MVDRFPASTPHIAMRALRNAAVAALLIVALGCSSGGSNKDAAGGSSGGGGGATGGGSGGATNATCQAIRICALATTDAQAAFQALYDCTVDPVRGNCASASDINCMCTAQYLQDPPCNDLVLACIGNITTDTIGDRCH